MLRRYYDTLIFVRGSSHAHREGLLLLLLRPNCTKVTQRKVRVRSSSCFVCISMLFAYSLEKEKKRKGLVGGIKVVFSRREQQSASPLWSQSDHEFHTTGAAEGDGAHIDTGRVKSPHRLRPASCSFAEEASRHRSDTHDNEHNHSWHDKLHEWFKPVGDAAVRTDCCCIQGLNLLQMFVASLSLAFIFNRASLSLSLSTAEERLPPLRLTVIKYHEWDFWLHLCPADSRPACMCLASAFQVGIVSGNWLNSIYIVMRGYLCELPAGSSNATYSWRWTNLQLSLSLPHGLKHKQLSVFGILLCAFFLLLLFWSFIIHPLPLSHRKSPQTGNFIQQQIRGEKKMSCSFSGWSPWGRLWQEMEGGGGAAVCHGCMRGQREPEEVGGDGEQSAPYLPWHCGALGRTRQLREEHILTCRHTKENKATFRAREKTNY